MRIKELIKERTVQRWTSPTFLPAGETGSGPDRDKSGIFPDRSGILPGKSWTSAFLRIGIGTGSGQVRNFLRTGPGFSRGIRDFKSPGFSVRNLSGQIPVRSPDPDSSPPCSIWTTFLKQKKVAFRWNPLEMRNGAFRNHEIWQGICTFCCTIDSRGGCSILPPL